MSSSMTELVEAEAEDDLEASCDDDDDDDDINVNTEDDWYFESLVEVSDITNATLEQ